MKFFRLDLLTLLISLFILNSCKNQNSLGLGVNSSNQISGTLVDTSTIMINTIPEDTMVTSGLPKNPLAYFNDPIYGLSVSNLATDLNLPGSTGFSLPSGTITIDSARLVLYFANGFYGDSLTSVYKVNVYQLSEQFVSGTTYYNDKQWNYSTSNLIGSLTFNSRTHDSVKVYDIISGAPDTLIKVAPQIRIPINNSFVNKNVFGASSSTLGSNSTFQSVVKGLYLSLDKTGTKGPGGAFMIKATDSLAIYYRAVNGSTIDTAVIYLPVSSLAAQVTHPIANYPSAIQAELNDTIHSNKVIYLQGLAGLRSRIKFPHLLANIRANLLKKDSDMVLNRAELVVTTVPGSNIPYSPLPKLTMYQLDLARQHVELQDANPADPRYAGIGTFNGFYNPLKRDYHFIITAYCQDLLYGKTIDYGTYLAPVDTTNTTTVAIEATPSVAARTMAVGTDLTSPYRIRLNVIYTKVAK